MHFNNCLQNFGVLNFIMETTHYISSDLLSIDMINEIVFQGKQLALSEEAIVNIEKCRKYLDDKMLSNSTPIYGINTGFGSLCNVKISNENLSKLQENLVKSHACGTGEEVPQEIVKLMLLLKIQSLSYGNSGVQLQTVERLVDFYNNDIVPVIYNQGSLGASGDLAPLAHLSLPLIGEGEVFYKGERKSTKEVFEIEGLEPINVEIREGLALMNGTSVMTGIGIVNIHKADKLLQWSIKLSCAINEIVKAYDDHLSEELNGVKHHFGQQEIARIMRNHLADSSLVRKREDHLYSGENTEDVFKEKSLINKKNAIITEYWETNCGLLLTADEKKIVDNLQLNDNLK